MYSLARSFLSFRRHLMIYLCVCVCVCVCACVRVRVCVRVSRFPIGSTVVRRYLGRCAPNCERPILIRCSCCVFSLLSLPVGPFVFFSASVRIFFSPFCWADAGVHRTDDAGHCDANPNARKRRHNEDAAWLAGPLTASATTAKGFRRRDASQVDVDGRRKKRSV